MQKVSRPGEYRGMKINLASYIVASTIGIMDNGNDPPACTLYLEFSDEKQKITKNSGLISKLSFVQYSSWCRTPGQYVHQDEHYYRIVIIEKNITACF